MNPGEGDDDTAQAPLFVARLNEGRGVNPGEGAVLLRSDGEFVQGSTKAGA